MKKYNDSKYINCFNSVMNDVNCEKRKRTMNYIGFLRPNQPGYGFKLYSSKT